MLELCPEAMDVGKHSEENWYARDSVKPSAQLGGRGRALSLALARKIWEVLGFKEQHDWRTYV